MSRFITIALLLHIPLFIYPVLRLADWLEWSLATTLTVLIPVTLSQIIARRVLYRRDGLWVFFLRNTADFILGAAFLTLIVLLVFEIAVFIDVLSPLNAGHAVLSIMTLVLLLGVRHAFSPLVREVRLDSSKVNQRYRFVQISDVHIGSRSIRFLEQLVHRINRLQPDFLCITGDFIDQPGITEDKLRSLKELQCPVYYCTGNHERYEDFDAIMQRLNNLGLNVLRNQAMQYEELTLLGIDDQEDALQVAKVLPTLPVDPSRYTILLYHRPVGLEACAEHGVDLMLSGHTHGGQIMPFNLLVRRVFDRTRGLYHFEHATLYVSEGTGTWGPFLRLGTRSEITLFTLHPC